jgi:tRNA (guanine26-N2/guanine27-N2)-dimethyltransferase
LSNELTEIVEGATPLIVPSAHSSGGPGTKQGRVFFNRQMAFNRDVSVMVFSGGSISGKTALDAMAASGARGVRIMNEASPALEFHINDLDKEAFDVIGKNIARNGVNAVARNCDLRCLLSQESFDYVDLDPFGTLVPFLHPAIQGTRRRGFLALTATDVAPLAGTHKRKCVRRYHAAPQRSPYGHETALRILIGYVVKQAATFDRGLRPLLCFYADHYLRMHFSILDGTEAADACLDQLGYVDLDHSTGRRRVDSEFAKGSAGPMWLGQLTDKVFLSSMRPVGGLAEARRCQGYLELWKEELDIPFYYENDELSSMLKVSPARRERVLEELRAMGPASRTHFSPTGFKTPLDIEDVLACYRRASAPANV